MEYSFFLPGKSCFKALFVNSKYSIFWKFVKIFCGITFVVQFLNTSFFTNGSKNEYSIVARFGIGVFSMMQLRPFEYFTEYSVHSKFTEEVFTKTVKKFKQNMINILFDIFCQVLK